jgi:hypothetical protein
MWLTEITFLFFVRNLDLSALGCQKEKDEGGRKRVLRDAHHKLKYGSSLNRRTVSCGDDELYEQQNASENCQKKEWIKRE